MKQTKNPKKPLMTNHGTNNDIIDHQQSQYNIPQSAKRKPNSQSNRANLGDNNKQQLFQQQTQ